MTRDPRFWPIVLLAGCIVRGPVEPIVPIPAGLSGELASSLPPLDGSNAPLAGGSAGQAPALSEAKATGNDGMGGGPSDQPNGGPESGSALPPLNAPATPSATPEASSTQDPGPSSGGTAMPSASPPPSPG